MDNKFKYSKKNILTSIIWKLTERSSSVIITFIIQILLARLLSPNAFGLAAIVTVFVTLSSIFVTGGLSNSLIQKKDSDDEDFSSVFWMNMVVSLFIYIILFFTSPKIADFFGYAELKMMFRVLGIVLIISAINSIQTAYISKNMLFKFYFYSTITSKILSGALGIIVAFLGGGAWALIIQSLSLTFFETIVLWLKVGWRPKFFFSLTKAKQLYSFAWKIMVMSFVESIKDQFRNLIIGKQYSANMLAFYDKGYLFPTNIVTNISSSLSTVMFPVLSNIQDETEKPRLLCSRWISMFGYMVLPVLIGLTIVAEPLTLVVLSEKWLPSVPFLQIASITYISWIIEVPIRETLKSLGFADVILRMQVIKTFLSLGVVFLILKLGVMAIALSGIFLGMINIVISLIASKKYFGYGFKNLFNDLFSTIVLNLIMGISIFGISLIDFSIPMFFLLFLYVILGMSIYLLLSYFFKNNNFNYVLGMVKELKGNKANR